MPGAGCLAPFRPPRFALPPPLEDIIPPSYSSSLTFPPAFSPFNPLRTHRFCQPPKFLALPPTQLRIPPPEWGVCELARLFSPPNLAATFRNVARPRGISRREHACGLEKFYISGTVGSSMHRGLVSAPVKKKISRGVNDEDPGMRDIALIIEQC